MSGKSGGRRQAANRRFRRNVLVMAERMLPELTELWSDVATEEDHLMAGCEAHRLADSADAVGLHEVAIAARELIGPDSNRRLALRGLARALRSEMGTPRLQPIQVVAGGRVAGLLRRQAVRVAEDLQIFSSVAELEAPASTLAPAAIVVPSDDVDAVPRLTEEGVPVLVYGPDGEWQPQRRAIEAGASAYLSREALLVELLERVRTLQGGGKTPSQVLLVGAESSERAAVADALERADMRVLASNLAEAVIPALTRVVPHAIVLLLPLRGLGPGIVTLARSHPHGAMPLFVVAAADAEPWLVAGADGVLLAGVSPESLTERVRLAVHRHRSEGRDRDLVTRLPTRVCALRRLDALVEHAHRRLEPLSVAIVEIDDLAGITSRWQRSGWVTVRSVVAQTLVRSVRCIDLVGCLGEDAFVIALRGVYRDVLEQRMGDVLRRYERVARSQHLMKDVRLRWGISDNEATIDRLLVRAQAALDHQSTG